MSSNGGTRGQSSQRDRSFDKNKPKDQSNPDSSLLKYFAEHPPVEEEVDIDFALNDHGLDNNDGKNNFQVIVCMKTTCNRHTKIYYVYYCMPHTHPINLLVGSGYIIWKRRSPSWS